MGNRVCCGAASTSSVRLASAIIRLSMCYRRRFACTAKILSVLPAVPRVRFCADTPLNPPGATRKAYSCEENCPTGALVRVNPAEYFSETGSTLGLILRDQTHGIGRNIHKSDPTAKLWHVGGIVAILLCTILVVSGLERYGFNQSIGGTWLTMRWLTGLVGLVGIAAVMTYPLRK